RRAALQQNAARQADFEDFIEVGAPGLTLGDVEHGLDVGIAHVRSCCWLDAERELAAGLIQAFYANATERRPFRFSSISRAVRNGQHEKHPERHHALRVCAPSYLDQSKVCSKR